MMNEPPVLKPDAALPKLQIYAQIVSLGVDCRLAYNLRRTFGIAHAFPFDWWVTPLPSLLRFLAEPSTAKMYDPDLLEPVMHGEDIFAIRNSYYGIELHHEFTRDKRGFVRPDWRAHIDQPRQRSEHLLGRFLSLGESRRKVLFVRRFKSAERRELRGLVGALAGETVEALKALFPSLYFHLLLIDPPEMVQQGLVFSIRVDDPERADWRGTPELWTARLKEARLALAGPAGEGLDPQPDSDQAAYV